MHSLLVVILLAVCSVNICFASHPKLNPHHHHGHHNRDSHYCFSEEDLANSPSKVVNHFVVSKVHWRHYAAVSLVPQLENSETTRNRRRRTTEATCPQMNTLMTGNGVNERSISPWTYRIDTDENRYPQKLAFARCLCNHCISSESGKETSAFNSVQVKQTMLVLRKMTCPHDSSLFSFKVDYISVPVACTCSVPKYDD